MRSHFKTLRKSESRALLASALATGLGVGATRGDDVAISVHSFSRALSGRASAGSCTPGVVYSSSSSTFEQLPSEYFSERLVTSSLDVNCPPQGWIADSLASADQWIGITQTPDTVIWHLDHTISGLTSAGTPCSGGSICGAVAGSYEMELTFETPADYTLTFTYVHDTYLGTVEEGVASLMQSFSLSDAQQTVVASSITTPQYSFDTLTWRLPAGVHTLRSASTIECVAAASGFQDSRAAASSAGLVLVLTFQRICPSVLQQPSGLTVCRGDAAQLSVSGDGSQPLAYRWFGNAGALVDGPTASGSIISGAATPTLSIANAGFADSAAYCCEISNGCVVYSATAVLLVSSCCPGDVDNDADVDLSDLGIVLAYYGCTPQLGLCPGDADGDNDVDLSDLGVVLAAYASPCD